MNENEIRVTLKNLRITYYECRNFELSYLWQRSIFLTTFLILCFTGYGYLLLRIIDPKYFNLSKTNLINNEIACIISLLGLTFSVIWIMMTKGSKAWYEIYEKAICEIDNESELLIPEAFRMGSLATKFGDADENLFSNKAGKYSVSKLNILIGKIMLLAWFVVFCFHTVYNICILIAQYKDNEFFCLHVIIVFILLFIFLRVSYYSVYNKWAKSTALD